MATNTQATRLRGDIGADETSLPQTEVNAIYEEAEETYTGAASIHAAVRVIALQRLLASSAKLTTYKQNQSSENASDVFDHLNELLDRWEKKLDKAEEAALRASQSVVRFGRPRSIPRRIGEYPDA